MNAFNAWSQRFGQSGGTGLERLNASLQRDNNGQPQYTVGNLMLILSHDPQLAGMLSHNEFTSQSLLTRAPPPVEDGGALACGPFPRPWTGEDVSLVQAYIQRTWIAKAGRQTVEEAMSADASLRRFHPIRDWLATLEWDGTPRINQWLMRTFGATDDSYHEAIGSKFLIAAVRRIRQPGCKFDYMVVLEGGQGIGKSTAIKEMFGEKNFSDAIPEELASRDAALALLGVWVLEFAEIQHLIRNEVEVIKAFLSRSTDRYRPPYGKYYVERARQGVLIGTTNATDYLRDVSGNRRIWPVRCQFSDVEWLIENRDQLWAEAGAREAAGESIWLDDVEVRDQATQAQAERMSDDVWSEPVEDWLSVRHEATTADALTMALGIPRERQSKKEEMRVAAIIAKAGWERVSKWDSSHGKMRRFWQRKEG